MSQSAETLEETRALFMYYVFVTVFLLQANSLDCSAGCLQFTCWYTFQWRSLVFTDSPSSPPGGTMSKLLTFTTEIHSSFLHINISGGRESLWPAMYRHTFSLVTSSSFIVNFDSPNIIICSAVSFVSC